MNVPNPIKSGVLLAVFCFALDREALQAQELRTMDYITLEGGRVYKVTKKQKAVQESEFKLTPDLTVLTNGIIKVAGDGEEKLAEHRKVSLDGFWMNDDGLLVLFKPHYMIKDGGLYHVESGVLKKLDHEVTLKNGAVLKTGGTVLTPAQKLIRLQDGQMLAPSGEALPPLDQVMMVDGKLVLQKDGSVVAFPRGSTIGMSDGTRVTGAGTITRPGGQQFVLQDGQRLILPGATMPPLN